MKEGWIKNLASSISAPINLFSKQTQKHNKNSGQGVEWHTSSDNFNLKQ